MLVIIFLKLDQELIPLLLMSLSLLLLFLLLFLLGRPSSKKPGASSF